MPTPRQCASSARGVIDDYIPFASENSADVSQCLLKVIQPPRFVGGLRDLAANYDVILCDVWGVVHNGVIQYEKATDALRRFRERGGSVVLITNAPRPRGSGFALSSTDCRCRMRPTTASSRLAMSRFRSFANAAVCRWPISGHRRICRSSTRRNPRSGIRLRFVGLDAAAYVVCIGLEHAERKRPADYDARLRMLRSHDARVHLRQSRYRRRNGRQARLLRGRPGGEL